ncbi:hypothetical protein TNCV_1556861 [Trichonephila clavipes]|nr:hypothetical protein TNCV_1556861 [Trichonephila clavipes]
MEVNRVREFWQRTRDPAVKSEFRAFSREGALRSVANHPLEKAEIIAGKHQKQFETNTEDENDVLKLIHKGKLKKIPVRSYMSRPGKNNPRESAGMY